MASRAEIVELIDCLNSFVEGHSGQLPMTFKNGDVHSKDNFIVNIGVSEMERLNRAWKILRVFKGNRP